MFIEEDNMKNKVTLTLNGKSVEVELTNEQLKELGVVEEKKELISYPEDGFFFAKHDNSDIEYCYNKDYYARDYLIKSGNCYSFEYIAKKSIDNLANRIKTWILEENEITGWEADWNNGDQRKYYVFYDYSSDKYYLEYSYVYRRIGMTYTSKESVIKLCKLLNDGWR